MVNINILHTLRAQLDGVPPSINKKSLWKPVERCKTFVKPDVSPCLQIVPG